MGTTNFGNQIISWKYKSDFTASLINKILAKLIAPGIFEGGTLTVYSATVARLDVFVAAILCPTGQLVKITTQELISITVDEDTPYIAVKMDWEDSATNYADIVQLASEDITSNHVIFGKCLFTAGSLTGFDLTQRTVGYITRINNIDTSIATLISRCATIESNVDSVESDIATAQGDIATLQDEVEAIATIENDILTIDGRVDTLETRFTDIESDFVTIQEQFENIETGFSSKLTDYTILDNETSYIFMLTGASTNSTFTLPTLADNLGKKIRLINNDSTYVLTVAGEGSETIEGCASLQLPKRYNFIEVIATSAGWIILDESITSQLRLNTYAGYGSTETKIMRFTNVVENVGNCFAHNHVSGYNSNAEGLKITINKTGKYSFSFTLHPTGATNNLGLSLNSAELTTNIEAITVATRLTMAQALTNVPNSVSIGLYLKVGDIIRPHSIGGAVTTYAANCMFSATYLGK